MLASARIMCGSLGLPEKGCRLLKDTETVWSRQPACSGDKGGENHAS